MKLLFAIGIGSALMIGAAAQQRTPPPITTAPPPRTTAPPPRTTAPPPAIPDFTPAAPRPGVAVGATGGIGSRSSGSVTGRVPTNAIPAPLPVVVPAGAHPVYPEPIDPLELALGSELLRMLEEPPPPAYPDTAQGRPGGLGVTITGGSTNAPVAPTMPPVTNTPAVTNTLPATNATGGTTPNPTYP